MEVIKKQKKFSSKITLEDWITESFPNPHPENIWNLYCPDPHEIAVRLEEDGFDLNDLTANGEYYELDGHTNNGWVAADEDDFRYAETWGYDTSRYVMCHRGYAVVVDGNHEDVDSIGFDETMGGALSLADESIAAGHKKAELFECKMYHAPCGDVLRYDRDRPVEERPLAESVLEVRKRTGMGRAAFAREYEIPIRTLENWEFGKTTCPEYFLRMMEKAVNADLRKKRAEQ